MGDLFHVAYGGNASIVMSHKFRACNESIDDLSGGEYQTPMRERFNTSRQDDAALNMVLMNFWIYRYVLVLFDILLYILLYVTIKIKLVRMRNSNAA